MGDRYSLPRPLQIIAIIKMADAVAVAAAEARDRTEMLSYGLRYAAFQIPACPGYEHLNQTSFAEKVVDMPSAGSSTALKYLYMAVHPLASPRPPGRAGIGIVSRGEIDGAQRSDANPPPLLQEEDDGVDPRLITAISHYESLPHYPHLILMLFWRADTRSISKQDFSRMKGKRWSGE